MNFASVSDEKIKIGTGKTWRHWVSVLEKFEAAKQGHRVTAKYLRNDLGLSDWWSQFITIRYEKEKGYWKRSGT